MTRCELMNVETSLEDQISQLPDDILVHILSRVEIKEAGRSSLLSRRWKDLWKFSTRLDFYAPRGDNLLRPEKYVTWVNEVLRLHEGASLEEFTIHFTLDASYSKDIDEWIKFSVTKRVKRLEISLGYQISDNYRLSEQCFQDLKNPSNPSSIACLTSLYLSEVNIGDDHLEYISKFPHLESLSVWWSNHLLNLKVAGNVVQLKNLTIGGCSLKSIELCAPKLVTFVYDGGGVKKIHIGNNPLLSDLYLGGDYYDPVVYALVPSLTHLPQLETLTLYMSLKAKMEIPNVPQMKELKNLMLEIKGELNESLIGLTSLIAAAPCLQKFTLKLHWQSPAMHRLPPYEPLNQPHVCLKEVEIYGFVGCRSDFELITYLLKNAVNLEKMALWTYDPSAGSGIQVEELTTETQERIEELRKSVRPGLQLVILQ